MFFKLTYITKNTDLNGQVLKLRDPESGMELTLRERAGDAPAPMYLAGDGLCEVLCEQEVSERLEDEARQKGSLSAYKESVEQARDDMYRFICRVLRIVRWRQGVPGDREPIRLFQSFEWSIDNVEWKSITDTLHLKILFGLPYKSWTNELEQSVEQVLLGGGEEPLGHELLREATSHATANPRSSVILAVAAAEVGFKRFVSDLLPETRWLVENLQLPPLEKLLTEFLPKLSVRNRIRDNPPFVPRTVIEEIKKAVLLRNDIIHGRKDSVKTSSVGPVLLAVHDLLYLLDFYAGVTWAENNISVKTRRELLIAITPKSSASLSLRGVKARPRAKKHCESSLRAWP